jgi:hypothetical protein
MIKPSNYGYNIIASTAREAIAESIKLDGGAVCVNEYNYTDNIVDELKVLCKSFDIDDNVIQFYGNYNYEHPWIVTVICKESQEKDEA